MYLGSSEGLTHSLALMASQIVEDNNITGRKRRYQNLLDIGFEDVAINGAINDEDKPSGIKPVLILAPAVPFARHVRPILFTGQHAFF